MKIKSSTGSKSPFFLFSAFSYLFLSSSILSKFQNGMTKKEGNMYKSREGACMSPSRLCGSCRSSNAPDASWANINYDRLVSLGFYQSTRDEEMNAW